MDFNLEHLKAFLVVARLGNLSAAAKELGTTQPNLGRQMTALEKEVRLNLFIRHSRGVGLTKQGQDFLKLCEKIVGQFVQGTNVIREQDIDPEGNLTIVTGAGSQEDIFKCLTSFSRTFPKLSFNFPLTLNVLQLSGNLHIGNADVAFSPSHFDDPDLVQHHIYDMVLRLYATPDYLKLNSIPQTLEELKSHKLIVYESEAPAEENKLNFQLINPETNSFYARPFITVSSGPSMRDSILNHLGIGPCAYDRELEEKQVLIDVFPDLPDIAIPYYYAYNKRLEGIPKIKAFHEFLKEAIRPRQRLKN